MEQQLLMDLPDLAKRATTLRTEQEILSLLEDLARLANCDLVLFGTYVYTPDGLDQLIYTNYSADFRSNYVANDFHLVDPTVTWCVHQSVPASWETIYAEVPAQNRKQRQNLLEEATSYGIRYGYSIPVHGGVGALLVC